MDRSIFAADADVHGPWPRPATSHEDGGSAEAGGFGRFRLESCEFDRITGCHEHGMDRDLRLDDVAGA
jgi:hypothetical protein